MAQVPFRRRIAACFVVVLGLIVSVLAAAPASATANIVGAWGQPLASSYSVTTQWHELGCVLGEPYYPYSPGRYHLGIDVTATLHAPVRSIGNGTVLSNQRDPSWGSTGGVANSGLLVAYTAGDGTAFSVLYGHVQLTAGIAVGTRVAAGQTIATIGSFSGGAHLHLGLHLGTAVPGGHWGTGTCPISTSHDNGFVNPATYLAAHPPYLRLTSTPIPIISGTAATGATLTAVPGTWQPAPVSLMYQWKANGAAISGATASTFIPTNTQIGTAISVTVTGSKSGYLTVSKTSAATARVPSASLPVSPQLLVYTDGAALSQTMDVSDVWWRDYKQAYALRLAQNIGWQTDFVSRFEGILSSGGSYGVYITQTSFGNLISIIATDDPNAMCTFTGVTTADEMQCKSAPGYQVARADYFTHNSYGGNGCYALGGVPLCSDDGMAMYEEPYAGTSEENWDFPLGSSSALSLYVMHFKTVYPSAYTGLRVAHDESIPPLLQ